MRRIVQPIWLRNIGVITLLAVLASSLAAPALAQGRAQVYILPPPGAVVTGQPVTVDVRAEGVSNLYGAEIHLRFDPTALRLEDADPQQEGVQLIPGSLLDPAQGFIVANRSDNQAGTAVFAVTLVNPASPVEGGGVLAQLTFVPLRPGALQFELEKVKLVTRDLQTLDVSLSGLEVQVGGQAITGPGAPASQPGPPAPEAGGAPPVMGAPIWMLVLVALAVVSIPLAGVWYLLVRETRHRPLS
ncbi:MAG: hypothetical protein Kow0063_01460 [Anaerolineae bacterium]